MENRKRKINNGGYAILFAVVIVTIISMITIGLTNSNYKQLVLSALATDSQLAFYQADTAAECALYLDNVIDINNGSYPWECGQYADNSPYSFDFTGFESEVAKFFLDNDPGNQYPCLDFEIKKTTTTEISAKGYSSCNFTSSRTVERGIKVSY